MIVRQLSVIVENRPGAITEVLAVLKENEVNLRASALAEKGEFGIFRIIVNDPEKVEELLRNSNYTVRVTQVLGLTLDDDAGSLYHNMLKLTDAGINVEYTYGFATSADIGARVILKVDNLQLAIRILNGQQSETKLNQEEDEIPEFYW